MLVDAGAVMVRCACCTVFMLGVLAATPPPAHAGGPEFPAGGTTSLGRGAAALARGSDPSVMPSNPALLADLWDDQALLGAHLLLAAACFQPTGYYGYGVPSSDVADLGEGPILLNPPPGTDLQGNPLRGYEAEPYDEVCYQGPAPFLPRAALSMKLDDELGVGLGFFPPDSAVLAQWGNRDGTIDTPRGKRPNPLRFFRSHQNASFFSLLGAVGYRPADFVSLGVGLQWTLVVFSARSWSARQESLEPSKSVRADVFGRDLFIPGVVASAQLTPFDGLEVALAFKWSDRIRSKAKLDVTPGVFGTGDTFPYLDSNGGLQALPGSVPVTTHDVPGEVDSPPLWAPQLALGVRFADRLQPRVRDRALARQAAGAVVLDSMLTERWDIEADAVYYFNSVYDHSSFTNDDDAGVVLRSVQPGQEPVDFPVSVGRCLDLDPDTRRCRGKRRTQASYRGRDQLSLRIGGDYNVLAGLLALRAGVSYEGDGQAASALNVLYYMLGRVGLHAGFTVRVAGKTDLSFAFAHFIQKRVRLQVNQTDPAQVTHYRADYRDERWHFAPGLGVTGRPGAPEGDFDGIAEASVPNGIKDRTGDGPLYANAGSYRYALDVLSVSIVQHF
jgi:hypothetical protein